MAGFARVRLNHDGVRAILNSTEVREVIDSASESVGSRTRESYAGINSEAEVVVESYTTDRAAGRVLVKHPVAMGYEAKYGALTSAALAEGLEVNSE